MRVFFRSAPALVALSVALAGCNQSGAPGSKPSAGSSSGVSANTAAAPADPSEYVLTINGMTSPQTWAPAVKIILSDLPCVDPNTVTVDFTTKQARFKAKKDAKVDIEEVKKELVELGQRRHINYTVTVVKTPASAKAEN